MLKCNINWFLDELVIRAASTQKSVTHLFVLFVQDQSISSFVLVVREDGQISQRAKMFKDFRGLLLALKHHLGIISYPELISASI